MGSQSPRSPADGAEGTSWMFTFPGCLYVVLTSLEANPPTQKRDPAEQVKGVRCPAPAFCSSAPTGLGVQCYLTQLCSETQHLPFSQEEGANRITCMATEDTFLFSSSSQIDTRKLTVPRKGSEALFNSRISVPLCKWDNDYIMPS